MDVTMEEHLRRRRKRWIWGCTGGCLGFMVAVTAAIIGVFLWLARAAPMPPPETFLTPGTSAFLFVRVSPEDPMMVEVPVRLAMVPAIREAVPTRGGRPLEASAEAARGAVLAVSPAQMVLVREPAEQPPGMRWGAAVSITHYGRVFRPLVEALIRKGVHGRAVPAPEAYGGGVIVAGARGIAFAVRGNNYMMADDKPLLRRWLDGIEAHRNRPEQAEAKPASLPAGMDPRLVNAWDGLDPLSPVRFACLNAHGEVAALLKLLPQEELRERLHAAGMAGPGVACLSGQMRGLNSRDAALTLRVACADQDTAALVEAALGRLSDEESRVPYVREPAVRRPNGLTVELTARIENLPDRVAALATRLTQADEQSADAEQPPAPPSP